MKKFVSALLMCVLLLSCVSAFAASSGINATFKSMPSEIDTDTILAQYTISDDEISFTSDLIFLKTMTGNGGWLTPDEKGAKDPNEYIILGNEVYGTKKYYVADNIKPKAGVEYYLYACASPAKLPPKVFDIMYFNINDRVCEFARGMTSVKPGRDNETDEQIFVGIYPIPFVAEEEETSETPETGDSTPVLFLGALFLLGAAGMVVASKRRHA